MPNCLTHINPVQFDEAIEKELAAYAKALGHPVRIKLLKILASGQCLGTDLFEQLELAQSTISEHLRILRQAGLIHAEVRHPRTCFSLKPEALVKIRELLNYFN